MVFRKAKVILFMYQRLALNEKTKNKQFRFSFLSLFIKKVKGRALALKNKFKMSCKMIHYTEVGRNDEMIKK